MDVERGWKGAADLGADVIQTDNPAALTSWIQGEDPRRFGLVDGST